MTSLSASSRWSARREKHLKTWVVQMAQSATLMARASSWLSRFATAITVTSQFCTAYTSIIPVATLGCPLVGQTQCVNLMISAIALAVVGSIVALMDGKLDLGDKAKEFNLASKYVMELARRIDLHLQRDSSAREDVDTFSEQVAKDYDRCMRNLPPLPRFIFRSSDLMNLTLLSVYIDAPNTPECPPLDTFVAEKLAYEMDRMQNLFP